MIAFALCLQLLGTAPASDPDSVYATPGLRRLVARAAERNRAAPAGFLSYRARIETELSFVAADSLGREQPVSIEQLATRASWTRDGAYDLHVLGYRAQSRNVPYSALSFVSGYTIPWLYGESLSLGYQPAGVSRVQAPPARKSRPPEHAPPRPKRPPLRFVHPFASDRDAHYRFSGGDTIAVLQLEGRAIPIVRIVVTPRPPATGRVGGFDGEIQLDAVRQQIVRMRGQLVTLAPGTRGHGTIWQAPGMVTAAYVDFVNAEVAGRYWLPATQRTEIQAAVAPLGTFRGIFRIVSSFSDYEVRDSAGAALPGTAARADSGTRATDAALPGAAARPGAPAAARPRVSLSYAPRDTMDRFGAWRAGLGEATADVHSGDFADLAPDAWRADGPPRLTFLPHELSESFRFNRVEGLYLGLSATVRFRDAFPGLTVGAVLGPATAERTLRGDAHATLARGPWILRGRAGRYLESSNDFRLPFGGDPGVGALFGGVDRADYVDRRLLAVSATRVLGSVDRALLTAELAVARDRSELQRVARGLFGGSRVFAPNRGALDGSYGRVGAELDLHPGVSGDFLAPGLGARLRYQAGAGALAWQRTELALSARRYLGPLSLAAHADGGAVAGAVIPPQQLFELGGSETLPGYAFKEFAGDRAALFRASARFRLPLFSRPVHAFRTLYLPGFSPALAASAQGAWAELSSDAARQALLGLGTAEGAPLSRPTAGVRATVALGFSFFSDFAHVSVARPVDRPAPWRWSVGLGSVF